MTFTALEIGPDARRKLNRLASFAIEPTNFYYPGPNAVPPGDDDRFVVSSGTHRIVFSVTVIERTPFRHLSVSLLVGDLPSPVSVFTLAHMLGFRGIPMSADGEMATGERPSKMAIGSEREPNPCVILGQKLLE